MVLASAFVTPNRKKKLSGDHNSRPILCVQSTKEEVEGARSTMPTPGTSLRVCVVADGRGAPSHTKKTPDKNARCSSPERLRSGSYHH